MRVPGLVIADIAKEEEHEVDGVRRRLSVHRKGAMRETFVSTCHGAGRRMSRTAAVKAARGAAGGDQGVTDAGRGRPGAW
jgi:RNA-splicing ligase RtcB